MAGQAPDNLAMPGAVFSAVQTRVAVVEQVLMARDTYRLRLRCPEVASQICPGQFFMVREPVANDPLLGRPFALYDIYEEDGKPAGIDFGYIVVGKLTLRMPHWKPGKEVELWGPLGNGFPPPQGRHLMMVAGGIGQTPFLATAREALGLRTYGKPRRDVAHRPEIVSLCYGARSREFLAGLEDFDIPGLNLQVATDDGSQGHHGFVTDLLKKSFDESLPPDVVYCCGPEPMMEVVANLCEQANVECWLSLETPMACGFGACFSCVTRIRTADGEWDYRRTCVEGPVFRGSELLFHDPDMSSGTSSCPD